MAPKINEPAPIWWTNATFFVGVHIAALIGVYYRPLWLTSSKTLLLTFVLWQFATFGITIGYHRLHSHKSFRVTPAVKWTLALLGTSACQGSIKWWALRHRLHHRYTDDPVHDPYAAPRGLLWAHMGWIFYKPRYEKMKLIDREDLDNDDVVNIQHIYHIPLTILTAFVAPVLIGSLWHDTTGALVWACLVKCLIVWHCTFLINSLAHWDGVQPYTDEDTSRTNIVFAMLTGGEGNHNFHAFPNDFRSAPTPFEWDPSKWIILTLYYLNLATGLRRAKQEDVEETRLYIQMKTNAVALTSEHEPEEQKYPSWTVDEARSYAALRPGRCLLVLNGYVVDATTYLGEHPGGATVLRKYALRSIKVEQTNKNPDSAESELWRQATWAFSGGLNMHMRTARRRAQELTVAKLLED